jgi:hypothetical protein
MRPRPGARTTPPGTGQFDGHRPPQATDYAGAGELLDGLFGDGAIRVSHTSARTGQYTAAHINPQAYLIAASVPNDNLATATQTAAVSRNAMNRRRGAGAR